MHYLQAQLVHVENSFLSSLSSGPTAIQAFSLTFSNLQAAFDKEMKQNSIDDETMTAFYQTVTRIEIIARPFVELFDHADALVASLRDDIDTIFANLTLDDESRSNPGYSDKRSKPSASSSVTSSSYIEPAYNWLLKNLHNPYPSKGTKSSIALETGSSLKDIDNWFIGVRKRIGWNKLRLKHFANKRSKIVDAATRFFEEFPQPLHHGPSNTHISTANHDSEFKAIENRAKKLYSEKLFDSAVRDLTPETEAHVQLEEEHCRVAKSRSKDLQFLTAYPSPEPSPEQSPEPSPASVLPIPDTTLSTSRKRRMYDRDSPEFDVEDSRDEPQKRSRLDSYDFSRDLGVASLPSPAASLSDVTRDSSAAPSDQSPSEHDCVVLPTPPIPAALPGKRKRRLSDAGNEGPSKRPHNALAVPRLQTVSDPLPLANPIISELYKTMFGNTISDSIPGPVSVESLDDTQVEVDFYNYNATPDTIQPLWLANSSSGSCPTTPLSSTATSELPLIDKFQAFEPSFGFPFFETYMNGLDPQASTETPFPPEIPSHDPPTLFSFENMLPIQPPEEDVLTDPQSYFQIPTPSWDFQGNDNSFSAFSAETLLSNNHVPPPVISTQIDKEAKLKQIEALRAQLQNLEAEL